jgi:hypothetical protein
MNSREGMQVFIDHFSPIEVSIQEINR